MPKISVLMPVYKTNPHYLKEAIESILNQTYTDFEFLILDDCPEDSREKIISQYKDKRIKYLKNKKNMGITPARNKLIDMAKGKYLAIIDHDDIALPERLAEEAKILDHNNKIGVVSSWVERFPKKKLFKYPEHNKEIEEYLMHDCAIVHTSAMIRKSALKNIRYEAEFSPAEDYRLWCQLIGKTTFYNIPKILMKYRWYEGNTTKKQSEKMKEAAEKIQALIRKKYPKIWENFSKNAPHIVRLKLFNVIPLGKFYQKGESYTGWLKHIPFISIKTKLKIE